MKKLLIIIMVLSTLLFAVSCGNSGIQDGDYSAQMPQDEHGWADTLTVTYSGGELTSATFESVGEDGAKKSELAPEEYPMDPPPSEWIPQLTDNVKASAGDPNAIEMIAGATNSSQNAKDMLAAINENAESGNTDTVLVEATQ